MAPPPLPRRHSVPTNTNNTTTSKHRRYSDYKNPKKSKLDLRQELINLNLNNQEVNTWLGNEYEEEFDYEQFQNDIPLQRSISLDGGIEIFKYLQTVGSDWSGSSVASSWSVDSDKDRMLEKCRSFEDIPASQSVLKSRRASSDFDYSFNKSLGLSVLRTSYKDLNIESGSISPRIKKLQRMFSFRNTLQDFKEASSESLCDDSHEPKVPTYKDISFETKIEHNFKEKNIRQRKHGTQSNVPYQMNLRKEILKRNVYYTSLQDLSMKKIEMKRRGSAGNKPELRVGLTLLKDSNKGIEMDSGSISPRILKLKRSFSILSSDVNTSAITTASESNLKIENRVAKYETTNTSNLVEKTADLVEKSSLMPELIVSNSCSLSNESINLNSKSSTLVEIPTNIIVNTTLKVARTSNLVDVSRNCGCRICREEGNNETSFLRRIIKSFMKILYGSRKLMYWDENNNLNDSEMLACLIQVLKFLFGLWLRNLDHNCRSLDHC